MEELVLDMLTDNTFEDQMKAAAIFVNTAANINEEVIALQKAVIDEFGVNPAIKLPMNNNNFMMKIAEFNETEFLQHFRMKKATMEALIVYLKSKTTSFEQAKVSFRKQVYMTIWTLANKDTYREIGNLFGSSKSTVNFIFHRMCKLLTDCRDDFIKWPTKKEQHVISTHVNNTHHFPNCVGFIDGCHVEIKAPKRDLHSVVLQATCDHTLKFTDIYLGETGQSRDAQVFKESPLLGALEHIIPADCHILGDTAYPLLTHLMIPYRDNGHLSVEQKKYNAVHVKARAFIRRAFSRLKKKFKRLEYLELNNVKSVTDIVYAACVLHNFILSHEPDDVDIQLQPLFQLNQNLSGSAKRHVITEYISMR
ncbi:hypothetical protein ILUMI_07523 [Ignelater luminosus]|uniref:DDE Tnp4 domain-containing protein n=1 Tax=Ignelater luminosus TaxID=2038154 RepID=A0A8K0D7X9_IGNLU|nr:hypothetical protein ILUMI_07523 [Ignelater luminosus]